jgi:hypothetical protein
MKKLLLIVFLVSTGLFAQGERHRKIKALKTAYITEQLNLSSAEAEKFWPVYNDFDAKMTTLRKEERRDIFEKIRTGMDTMSDEEANLLLDKVIAFKTSELEYNTEMVQELRKVLSPKKIIKLKKVEEDFKRRLLEKFRERKNHRE